MYNLTRLGTKDWGEWYARLENREVILTERHEINKSKGCRARLRLHSGVDRSIEEGRL
jgi:hypothetical protein